MVLVISPCAFLYMVPCDGSGEDSLSVFFPHVLVVGTKFISSLDTMRPASKRYYVGSSPADATDLY